MAATSTTIDSFLIVESSDEKRLDSDGASTAELKCWPKRRMLAGLGDGSFSGFALRGRRTPKPAQVFVPESATTDLKRRAVWRDIYCSTRRSSDRVSRQTKRKLASSNVSVSRKKKRPLQGRSSRQSGESKVRESAAKSDQVPFAWLLRGNWKATRTTSQYLGVTRKKDGNIQAEYCGKILGSTFVSEEEAARAYDREALKHMHSKPSQRFNFPSQGQHDRTWVPPGQSKYRGVSRYFNASKHCKGSNKVPTVFQGQIKVNGKAVHLGYHPTEIEAVRAYATALQLRDAGYSANNSKEKVNFQRLVKERILSTPIE